MRLVINIARGYKCPTIPIEDLIQEGAIGLMMAIERFEPERGFRFSTYATHWIRQSIGRAVDGKSKSIRLPAHVSQAMRKIERERLNFFLTTGKEPTNEQLAELCCMPVAKLQMVLASTRDVLSLDLAIPDVKGTTLGGLLPDTTAESPEDAALLDVKKEKIAQAIKQLNEREQQVLFMRYTEFPGRAHSASIAERLSIPVGKVRQIELQALKKLQAIAEVQSLREVF